ncbi:PucR family transcriptional regulator [Nocardia sp. NPDC051570]|uniref:PucR family transcriptional regulator n=1 Tax=Nocardia sp. NPDC051570 TaxID=3364324 RepID=UPI0037ACC82A
MTAKAPTARRRLLTELAERRSVVLDRIVTRARSEIPAYVRLDPAEVRPLTGQMVEALLDAFVAERGPSDEELRGFREFGVVRGRQGVSLTELLAAWRIGLREILDEITEIGRSHKYPDRVQLELTRQLLDIVDTATSEFSNGHREVELENARHDHQARADFTRAVLSGTAGRAELAVRAQHYGIETDHHYLPFRIRPTLAYPLDELARLLVRPDRTGFTTTVDGDLAGFTDLLPEKPPVAVGFAAAAPIDQLSAGFVRATRALNTMVAFGHTGAQDLDALGLLPAVLADAEIGDNLVRRYLDPLRRTDSPDLYLDTLRRYLDNGQHIESTARDLIVHPNTVRYRIDRFRALTGADLRKPAVALELWWALRRRQISSC